MATASRTPPSKKTRDAADLTASAGDGRTRSAANKDEKTPGTSTTAVRKTTARTAAAKAPATRPASAAKATAKAPVKATAKAPIKATAKAPAKAPAKAAKKTAAKAPAKAAKKPTAKAAAKAAKKPTGAPKKSAAKAAVKALKKPTAKATPKPATPGGRRAAAAPAAITPQQALANTRVLLEAKQAHAQEGEAWQSLDPGHRPEQDAGFQSQEARAKAVELHAAESRLQAIQGSVSTKDRRNQGKRDHR